MNLDELRDSLPEYARDIRLNLGSVLTPQGAPGLAAPQIAAAERAAPISAGDSFAAASASTTRASSALRDAIAAASAVIQSCASLNPGAPCGVSTEERLSRRSRA